MEQVITISKTEKRKAFKKLEEAITSIIQAQAILHDYSYSGHFDPKPFRGKYKELRTAIEKCIVVRDIVLKDLSSL